MKRLWILVGSLLLTSAFAAEEVPNPQNGKKLFDESRCLQCHGVDIFTRVDRKVKNLNALESMVRRCDANLSTNWFDDQILDVVAYLNQSYYKFEKEEQSADTGSALTEAETTEVLVSEPDSQTTVVSEADTDKNK